MDRAGSGRLLAGVLAAAAGLAAAGPAAAVSAAQAQLAAVRACHPDAQRGAQLFGGCAACHGSEGGGSRDGGVPRIAGQHASVIEQQLVDYRFDRRWDLRMEQVAARHQLADAQAVADVAAWVSALTAPVAVGAGPGRLVDEGRTAYAAHCRSCHGAAGQGDGARAVPRLAGQQYEYLRRQVYDAVDGRRPNFSAAHIRLLARLDRDAIEGIADYLSRLDAARPVPPAR